jgi:hypothetical protein
MMDIFYQVKEKMRETGEPGGFYKNNWDYVNGKWIF